MKSAPYDAHVQSKEQHSTCSYQAVTLQLHVGGSSSRF